jgi:hypothetical protein
VTYLITFASYGCHLHGDERGAVDRRHNLPGSPMVAANSGRLQAELMRMHQPAYRLDTGRHQVVLAAMRVRYVRQNWTLLAAHVGTNHVHLVVEADTKRRESDERYQVVRQPFSESGWT